MSVQMPTAHLTVIGAITSVAKANSIAIINQLYYYRKIVITIIYYIRTLPIVKL